MPNHNQPTPEELQAQLDESIAALDKEDKPTDPQEDGEKDPQDLAPQDEETKEVETTPAQDEEDEGKEIEAGEKDDETPEDKPTEDEDKPKSPPIEERYKESTKEAQRLYKNNVQINKAIVDADSMPEPTEDELKAAYSNWEELDDDTKEIKKELLINRRFREKIKQAAQEQRSVEEWIDKVDKFVENPQSLIDNPELEGKTGKFKDFANTKENQGIPFSVLVGAFLHSEAKNPPAPKKGKMIETPSAGPNGVIKPKSDKISVEQAATLRQTDYKKYKEYLLAGKIEQPQI